MKILTKNNNLSDNFNLFRYINVTQSLKLYKFKKLYNIKILKNYLYFNFFLFFLKNYKNKLIFCLFNISQINIIYLSNFFFKKQIFFDFLNFKKFLKIINIKHNLIFFKNSNKNYYGFNLNFLTNNTLILYDKSKELKINLNIKLKLNNDKFFFNKGLLFFFNFNLFFLNLLEFYKIFIFLKLNKIINKCIYANSNL